MEANEQESDNLKSEECEVVLEMDTYFRSAEVPEEYKFMPLSVQLT